MVLLEDSLLAATLPHQPQPRLLLVDGQPETAKALQPYLTRQGYQVEVAYNGAQALLKIHEARPDLLIMDLTLPDKSALDMTMELRAHPDWKYLPVIIITDQNEERLRLQSMLSGADDYLQKPVRPKELVVRVQALLRTKSQIDRLLSQNDTLLKHLQQRNAELEGALNKAREVEVLKKNILDIVSHELNTPLLQVKASVDLLAEDVRKNDPDNTLISMATQAVGRLADMIQNISQLAKANQLKQEPFLMKDAVNQALRDLKRSWSAKEEVHRIQVELPNELPFALGDRQAVGRVMHILLDNALKFDPQKQPVRLGIRVEGREITVTVQDSGIGIPKDKQARIFEAFYQVDSSSTRRFNGAGVGLSLAWLLCEELGTRIYVESAPQEGSTFWFALPITHLPD